MNSSKSKVAGWSSVSIHIPAAQSDTGSALGRTGFQDASAPATSTVLEIAWPEQISPPGNPHLSLRARYRYISNMTATCACRPHTKLALSLLQVSVGHGVGNNPQHSTPNAITITYICKEQNAFCVEINENEEEALGRTKRVHTNTCMSLHIHMQCTCRILHTNVYGVLRSSTQEEGEGMKKTRRKKGPEDQEDEQNHKDKENQQENISDPKYFLLATYINLQSYLGNYRLSKLCSTLAMANG